MAANNSLCAGKVMTIAAMNGCLKSNCKTLKRCCKNINELKSCDAVRCCKLYSAVCKALCCAMLCAACVML